MDSQKTMRAIRIEDFSKPVKVIELPIPTITSSQVLVRQLYSPINPSDVLSTRGKYLMTAKIPTPFTAGFEGSGEIVEVGKDLESRFKPKDKVYYTTLGSWAEYAAVDGKMCHVLPPDAPLDVASCTFVNPMTVYTMLLELQAQGHKSVVHTAGSSSLGRMFIKVMKEHGIKTINLVRKDEYISELKDAGADYVLNTNDADFEKKFEETVAAVDCHKVYDAICGKFTGRLVWLMPDKSNISVYGVLSEDPQVHVDFWALLSKQSSMTGFWLSKAIENHPPEKIGEGFQKIFAGLRGVYATKISKVFKLEEVCEAIKYSVENGSLGKVLLSSETK